MKIACTFVFIFLFWKVPGEPVVLTEANFNDTVLKGGRNAFVKFHAPWCGHCREIRPVWDKLGEVHKDSKEAKTVLIGDVDCTDDEAKPICDRISLSGYPTFKFFTRETGEEGADYHYGRTLEGFDDFVTKDLMQVTWCNAKTKENCNDEQLAYISEQQGRTKEELSAELDRLTEVKKYGTPYKRHPEHSECEVMNPGPICNPRQKPDLEPKKAFQCCNSLGDDCAGFLFVSSDAQKARDGDDKASVYFCKGGFFQGEANEKSAVAYLKPEHELEDSKPESKTWLIQRIEMLESLLDKPREKQERPDSMEATVIKPGDNSDLEAALAEQERMRREREGKDEL